MSFCFILFFIFYIFIKILKWGSEIDEPTYRMSVADKVSDVTYPML